MTSNKLSVIEHMYTQIKAMDIGETIVLSLLCGRVFSTQTGNTQAILYRKRQLIERMVTREQHKCFTSYRLKDSDRFSITRIR